MVLKRAFLYYALAVWACLAHSQILFTESFTVILDTTKVLKGSLLPNFKYQNLKEDLIEIENQADIALLLNDNALTLANKVGFSRFGEETILSGGYVYGEYSHIYEKPFTLEVYGQVHWAEARGMERKYALGIHGRWRIIRHNDTGLFFGVGPFYEFERWNFDGISDPDLIPLDESVREMENIKLGSYISFKYKPVDAIFIDISLYHQSRFDEVFTRPRIATSSRITYNFTRFLGLALTYQNIYDPDPLVPIDKLFNHLVLGVSINF